MSLPGLMAQPVIQAMGQLNPIDAILGTFNSNPYFIGVMMLFLNLGGRFLIMEVSKEQEKFFQNPWVRRFLIFTVLFVATRNILVAFVLTLFVVLTLGYLFNENSALCIFKSGRPASKCAEEKESQGPALSMEEQEILRRLTEKQMRLSKSQSEEQKEDDTVDETEVYMANLSLLRR
jgi:hypothetical protein